MEDVMLDNVVIIFISGVIGIFIIIIICLACYFFWSPLRPYVQTNKNQLDEEPVAGIDVQSNTAGTNSHRDKILISNDSSKKLGKHNAP